MFGTRYSAVRKAVLGGLLLAGGAIVAFAAFRPLFPAPPRIWIPSCPLNLGYGAPGAELAGKFPLRNVGGSALEYRIKASCGGTRIEPREGSLLPGAEQSIEVHVRLPAAGVPNWNVELTIEQESGSSIAVYAVQAASRAPLSAQPPSLEFGSVALGASAARRFVVLGPDLSPLPRNERLSVAACDDRIVLRPVERSEQCEYEATLKEDLRAEYVQGMIVLSRGDAGEQLTIPVSAYITAPLLVAPAHLNLTLDETAPVERSLLVSRNDGRPLGRLTAAQAAPGIMIEDATAADLSTRRVLLVRVAGDLAYRDSEQVGLTFGDQRVTAELRIRVRAEASSAESPRGP
jgi:hypothetical protein